MKNSDYPAMPLSGDAYQDFAGYNPDKKDSSYNPECQGLTKREMFAIKVMAGFAACDEVNGKVEDIASHAVIWADTLLEELAK